MFRSFSDPGPAREKGAVAVPDAAEAFAAALRGLYEHAGRPPYRVLVRQANAQRPRVRLNDASLSDWLNGKSTPSNPAAVEFLVTYLQAKATAREPAYRPVPLHEWEHMRAEAERERHRDRGGRPARPRAGRLPAVREPVAVPRQLPAVPVDFTGRRRELHELTARCADPAARSPVVIAGLAGVGKSALALRLAHDLAPDYPDGQLYASMRGRDGPVPPGPVVARFLRALGTPADQVPADPSEQAALYRSLLTDRKVVILLDDVTAEHQVRPLLPGSSSSLVLITSRNPLPALAGAVPYRLDPLTPAESTRLLGAISGRQPDDPASGEQIVELCGRLPLAIRIAAARLRARTDWAPIDLASRLRNTRGRLHELRVGDLDVRASFHLSYQDLPAGAARLFRRLGAVPGTTFSTELAAAMLGAADSEFEELFERLLLDQLVAPSGTPGRYQMHPLMHVFAAELLVEDQDGDATPAVEAMFEWYTKRLAQVTAALFDRSLRAAASVAPLPRAEARAWLDAEESVLIDLLGFSDHLGLHALTAAMAHATAIIAQSRALWADWKQAIDLGLAAAERQNDHMRRALLLEELGEYQVRWLSDPTAATRSYADAIALIDGIDLAEAAPVACRLHYRLAQTNRDLGNDQEAERELAEAAAIAATTGDPAASLIVDQFRAESLMAAEKYKEAIELLRPMASIWEAQNVREHVALRLLLANAYEGDRQYSAALDQLRRCKELCEEYGLRAEAPHVLFHLGLVQRACGFRKRARDTWEQGLALFDDPAAPENPGMAGRFAFELADHHSRKGAHARADELFAYAADAFASAGQPVNRSGALDKQAREKLAMGDPHGAASVWETALAGLDQIEDQAYADQIRRQFSANLSGLPHPAP